MRPHVILWARLALLLAPSAVEASTIREAEVIHAKLERTLEGTISDNAERVNRIPEATAPVLGASTVTGVLL